MMIILVDSYDHVEPLSSSSHTYWIHYIDVKRVDPDQLTFQKHHTDVDPHCWYTCSIFRPLVKSVFSYF